MSSPKKSKEYKNFQYGKLDVFENTLVSNRSEQIIAETSHNTAHYLFGKIDLSQMRDGDTVMLRVFVKIRANSGYKSHAWNVYKNVQDPQLVTILPQFSVYGVKVTLKQTAGANKSYDYIFGREYNHKPKEIEFVRNTNGNITKVIER